MRASARSVNPKCTRIKHITAKVTAVDSLKLIAYMVFCLIMNRLNVGCAYKKGICAMCGKQVLDTSSYKQSSK